MFFSYLPETVAYRKRSQDCWIFKHFKFYSVELYYSVLSHAWLDMSCSPCLFFLFFFLLLLLNNTLNQNKQRFIFWEDYILVLAGLNREVPVLLFNFFFSMFLHVSYTYKTHFCVMFFPPAQFSFSWCLPGLHLFVFSLILKETRTCFCPIKWETLPLILLDTGFTPVLLKVFSCPGTVYSFLSLSIFLLIEFTCCLPFSRLTELLSKIMSGASALCCHIINFLHSDKCVAICLILMCLRYSSRLSCCDGFDGQIKLY